MFKITANKGFQIKFANGNTVSVQFGSGNYCENRTNFEKSLPQYSKSAEVWAWDENGEALCDAQGWQTPEEVAAFIAKYSA